MGRRRPGRQTDGDAADDDGCPGSPPVVRRARLRGAATGPLVQPGPRAAPGGRTVRGVDTTTGGRDEPGGDEDRVVAALRRLRGTLEATIGMLDDVVPDPVAPGDRPDARRNRVLA